MGGLKSIHADDGVPNKRLTFFAFLISFKEDTLAQRKPPPHQQGLLLQRIQDTLPFWPPSSPPPPGSSHLPQSHRLPLAPSPCQQFQSSKNFSKVYFSYTQPYRCSRFPPIFLHRGSRRHPWLPLHRLLPLSNESKPRAPKRRAQTLGSRRRRRRAEKRRQRTMTPWGRRKEISAENERRWKTSPQLKSQQTTTRGARARPLSK